MNNTILLKRSAVQNGVPSVGDLQLGELAMNTHDGDMFFQRESSVPGIVPEVNKVAVYKTVHTGDTYTVESLGFDSFTINGDQTGNFNIGDPLILTNGTDHHDATITAMDYSSTSKNNTTVSFDPASAFDDATMVMFNPMYLKGLVVDGKIYYDEGGVYTEVELPTGLERFIDAIDPLKEGWKFIDNPSTVTGLGSVNLMRNGDAPQDGMTYVDGLNHRNYNATQITALVPDAGSVVYGSDDKKLQVYNGTGWENVASGGIDGGSF